MDSCGLAAGFFRGGLIGTEKRSPLLQGFNRRSMNARSVSFWPYAKRAGFGIWKETASGGKDGRPERKQVMALAFNRYLAEVEQCLRVLKGASIH